MSLPKIYKLIASEKKHLIRRASTSLLINSHSNLTLMGFISDVIVSHESNLGGYESHLGGYEFLEVWAGSKWDWIGMVSM